MRALRHKWIGIVGGLFGAIAIIFIYIFNTSKPMMSCQIVKIGSAYGPKDHDASVEEELCDGIGGSDTVYIYLSSKYNSEKWLVFSYGRLAVSPNSNRKDVPPKVIWSKNGDLNIEIDAVNFVITKKNKVNGTYVNYGPFVTIYK